MRTLAAAEALAILRRCRSRFGVSRVGSTTALDVTGVPTAVAVRSDFLEPGVSVASGKGKTPIEAEVSALGEALERFCAERRDRLRVVRARRSELDADALRPSELILARWSRATDDTVIEWCLGRRLDDCAPVWVPANATFFPFESTPEEQLFRAHTTGLAAGASASEAALFGLLECIENDQYARAVARLSRDRDDAGGALGHGAASRWARDLCERLQRVRMDVVLHDITADLGVPTAVATLRSDGMAHLGCASRPELAAAVDAALAEACQSRVTDIQGAREDLAEPAPEAAVHPWFTTPRSARRATASFEPALDEVLRRLRAAGLASPVVVDLTLTDVPLTVVRVATPGLETWASDPDRAGPRVRSWLA